MSYKVLIVDDDPHIREVVKFALEKANMQSWQAKDGEEALDVLKKFSPDILILDVSMPNMNGIELCKEIRKSSDTPILFLSSMDDEIDRIVGFEIGADDYVTKPFSPRELVARIKAILKRNKPNLSISNNNKLQHGDLFIQTESYQVTFKSKPIELTAIEFAILHIIISRPTKVFSRNDIMDNAYKDNLNVSDRTIDSHIRNIRKKLDDAGCKNAIDTVHGIGFKAGICN